MEKQIADVSLEIAAVKQKIDAVEEKIAAMKQETKEVRSELWKAEEKRVAAISETDADRWQHLLSRLDKQLDTLYDKQSQLYDEEKQLRDQKLLLLRRLPAVDVPAASAATMSNAWAMANDDSSALGPLNQAWHDFCSALLAAVLTPSATLPGAGTISLPPSIWWGGRPSIGSHLVVRSCCEPLLQRIHMI